MFLVCGTFLHDLIYDDWNFAKDFVRNVTSNQIFSLRKSELTFGDKFSKPVITLEGDVGQEEKIYIAIQESFEEVSRYETIGEFLIHFKDLGEFKKVILIIINYFEPFSTNLSDKTVFQEAEIYDVNLESFGKVNNPLRDYLQLLKNPLGRTIVRCSDAIKIKALEVAVLMENSKDEIEKKQREIRERRTFSADKKMHNNRIYNVAAKMYCVYGFSKKFIMDLFQHVTDDNDLENIALGENKIEEHLEISKEQTEYAKKMIKEGMNDMEIRKMGIKSENILLAKMGM